MNRNEPKQCTNTWQITEVSHSTKQYAEDGGDHANQCPLELI